VVKNLLKSSSRYSKYHFGIYKVNCVLAGQNHNPGWIKAKGLVPNDAYTVWWVYFDDPTLCETPGECGAPKFGGDNPLVVIGLMDSSIAPGRGKLHFSGRIGGFKSSRGSQIWMWIFAHGAALLTKKMVDIWPASY
jgi:hypothetical protein